ncbi:MAG: T9SS type A sorting domain-containing protein [Bacteroidales bacterium]|nr:T9SS type A sorting domain-containing protein [Bacteroidales bacterium]
MKKTFTILIAAIAAILMMAQPMKVWGQVSWERVTSVSTLTNGGTFIMGYEATANSGVIVPLRTDASGATTSANGILYSGTGAGNTSNNGTITMSSVESTAKYEIYITASQTNDGAINLQLGSSSGNYIGSDSNNNNAKLFAQASNKTAYTPTMGLNNVVTLTCASNSRILSYNNSSGSYRYCNYGSSGQQKVVFYKKNTGSTPVDPTITFNNGSVNVGKTLDLSTKFTSNSSGAVTYSITTGDSYATLSGSILTGVAEGSVTVKASQAKAGSYNAGEATATIIVNAAPTLSSITITTPPTKTTYTEGETFDATGMVVTATYSDASTEDVTASCSWTPNGALTTSDTEITVSYTEGGVTKTATQAITVNEYVQPTQFNIALNNTAFGCSTGSNGEEQSLTINRTVVVAGCASNAQNKTYYDASHVRFYANSYLRITAPTGYNITKTVFTADGTWNGSISTNEGTYTNGTKTWEGSTSQLDFSFAAQNRISSIAITLAVPGVEYDITYATGLINGAFAAGNPTSASEDVTVTITTVPAAGYHLATMTYNDGTTTENATVSGNAGTFTMPASDVTVSATFDENVAIFTEGVYSEPMTTQGSFDNMTVIDNGGDQTWQFDSQYKYAKINGYVNNTNNANEDWLITPKMAVTNGKLDIAFETYHNSYGAGQLSVQWATSLNGSWNDAGFSEGDAGSFVASNLTITTNATDIFVAFVYESTSSAAGTWEVKNFTAKQYYNITNGNPANGSITIFPDDKQAVGGTVLVEATPTDNYHFVSWNITPAVTVESDAFIMPAANVTVSAVFEQDVYYTITYNENETTNTDEVLGGSIGSNLLESPVSEIPANLTFVGWSTSQIGTYTTTQPELVDATYNVTGDVTFYAVYKYDYSYNEGGGTPTWRKVTDASTLRAGDRLVIASDGDATEKVAGSVGSGYMAAVDASDLFDDGVMSSLPDDAVVLTLGGEENAWTLTNNNQLLGANSKNIVWDNGTMTWRIQVSNGDALIYNGDSDALRFLYNVNSPRFKTYDSNATASMILPQLYRLEDGSTTVSGTYYLTSVTEIATETTIAAYSTTTLTNNVTVNSTTGSYVVNGILDGAGYIIINEQKGRLVVNNGGQLICDNSVAATVYKAINAWNTGNKTGWYLLASPITSATISGESPTISNLITTSGYDLFRYNESDNYWQVYKEPNPVFTSFENGRGYLYRNEDDQDVTFTGSTNTSVTYNLSYANAAGDLKGFNIIGNPFTHNITWTDITKSNVNPNGYYTLGTDGNWTIHKLSGDLNTNTIAPMQGFLVQATGDSPYVTFGTAKKNNETKANNDYIEFMVSNSQYNDVTYALFDKGDGINKIDHRNAEIPMLYISQDGKNYAIATMGDDTQMFDLSFEAKTMGTYTISMNAKGNFSYIHLIDRLTGDDTNLLIEDYSFIGSPQDNAERFIVKLSYDNGSSTGSETFAYQSGNEIIVNGEGTLEVYDVTGRKVMTTTINGVETINGLNSGVYIFRVIGETLKTQKIVVR